MGFSQLLISLRFSLESNCPEKSELQRKNGQKWTKIDLLVRNAAIIMVRYSKFRE
jgi:hypothetical protein